MIGTVSDGGSATDVSTASSAAVRKIRNAHLIEAGSRFSENLKLELDNKKLCYPD